VLPLSELQALREELRQTPRVLVVGGQQQANEPLLLALRQFAAAYQVPVVGDVISNLHLPAGPSYDIRTAPLSKQDVFIAVPEAGLKEALRPELLITFGQSLISKALKLYLREYAPRQHWHIQPAGAVADTFKTLTRVIRTEPASFFEAMLDEYKDLKASDPISVPGANSSLEATNLRARTNRLTWATPGWARGEAATPKDAFTTPWERANGWATDFLTEFFKKPDQPFNEFTAFHRALKLMPDGTALHLANSMAVRYANIIGIPAGRSIEVFANRGTSGIDGCNSTAVGMALAQPKRPVVLMTGDVAFFYDRNAFWHNYPTPNLRVVLFNNHAGGIFRLIDGPKQQPELEEFFETRQMLTAENTARDFGLRYYTARTFAELEKVLPVFFAPNSKGNAALLEITTDSPTNAAFFEQYRTAVRSSFSS
jgi:2-succinyl-5-enolpyruvyl-6-hydroxy-3-cyclohexene-1-carboxylate synthase